MQCGVVGRRRQTSSHTESFQAGEFGAALVLGKFFGLLHKANKMEAETDILGFLIMHPFNKASGDVIGAWSVLLTSDLWKTTTSSSRLL